MKHFELEESDGWNAFVLDLDCVGVQRGVRAGVPLGAKLSDGVEGGVDGLPLLDVAFVVGLVVDAASGAQYHWYGEQASSARSQSGDGELPHFLGVFPLDERPVAEEAGVRRHQNDVVVRRAVVREASEHDVEHVIEVRREDFCIGLLLIHGYA